ncbi:MAG: 16S rRNA (guanine(966)-N(2))-methyltransferase RsmD [Acutalibacteraceae bacterium]|nr:16S rRNA (guanine(966)-N(2))-methyltransferase RsmD [Acutalibacteraceae bacterium]
MRIITGLARGKRLVTPEGRDVRPTPERVKEGLFSALQFDIEGRRVLDLFAGSGQLGLEALSRGAESAVFVDASDASVKIVKQNIEITGFSDKAKVFRSDYASFAAAYRDTFDIAFLDPPYAAGLLMPAIKAVLPLMSDYGTIVCEHPPEVKLEEKVGGFSVSKIYRYGKVLVTVYRKGETV